MPDRHATPPGRSGAPDAAANAAAAAWLSALSERFAPAVARVARQHARQAAGGDAQALRQARARLGALAHDPELLATVGRWQSQAPSRELRRALAAIAAWLRELRVVNDPQVLSAERLVEEQRLEPGRVAGRLITPLRLAEILAREPEGLRRRRAFFAAARAGSTRVEPLRELVAVRNRVARAFGARDFAALLLARQALSPAGVLALLRRLERATRPAYEAFVASAKRRHAEALRPPPQRGHGNRVLTPGLTPWDLPWLLADAQGLGGTPVGARRAAGIARRTLEELGVPADACGLRITWGEFDRPARAVAGGSGAVRLLIAREPASVADWAPVLGAYAEAVVARGPKHALPDAPVFARGLAAALLQASGTPVWFSRHLGIAPDRAIGAARGCRLARLVELRQLLSRAQFELALFAREPSNPGALAHELDRRHLGYTLHTMRAPVWAGAPGLIEAPLGATTAVLGACIGAQVLAAWQRRGRRTGESLGAWVMAAATGAALAPSSGMTLLRRVRALTGKALAPDDLLRALGVMPHGRRRVLAARRRARARRRLAGVSGPAVASVPRSGEPRRQRAA